MNKVFVNGRYRSHAKTGMQNYAAEVTACLDSRLETIVPKDGLKGPRGHLWEQCYLPAVVGGKLLWSPNNTGPLAVTRQVCTIHDLFPIDHPEWFRGGFSLWYQWLLPRLVHRVEHLIAVSEYTKQRIIERFRVRPEKITVIHNGVGSEFTPRSVEEIDLVRETYAIPYSRYFLFVGSVEPRKNIARLVQAWKRIEYDFPGTGLVLAGPRASGLVFSGVDVDTLSRNVHCTGYVAAEHLPALYAGSLGVVYPSLAEGFGLPALEAMACGAAVVTSNNSALPEVVGDAAVGVDPFDVASIADGMRRIATSQETREQCRVRGLARAKLFSWQASAQGTWNVLERYA